MECEFRLYTEKRQSSERKRAKCSEIREKDLKYDYKIETKKKHENVIIISSIFTKTHTRSPFLRSSDHMRSEHAFSTSTALGTDDDADDDDDDADDDDNAEEDKVEDEAASGSVAEGRRAATSAGNASCAGASESASATACDQTAVRSPRAGGCGDEQKENKE